MKLARGSNRIMGMPNCARSRPGSKSQDRDGSQIRPRTSIETAEVIPAAFSSVFRESFEISAGKPKYWGNSHPAGKPSKMVKRAPPSPSRSKAGPE